MDFLPFTSVAMETATRSPKRGRPYLSRSLAREKATCPGCGKVLQVGTIAWSHKCSSGPKAPPSNQVIETHLAKMVANASRKHAERMANDVRQRSRSRGAAESTSETTDASSPGNGTEVNSSACSADKVADIPSNSC